MADFSRAGIALAVTASVASFFGGFVLGTVFGSRSRAGGDESFVTLPVALEATSTERTGSGCYKMVEYCLQLKDDFARPKGCAQLASDLKNYGSGGKLKARHSSVIGGCIVGLVVEAENQWEIYDLQGSVMSDRASLFSCSSYGVDNVILAKAREFQGFLDDKPFRDYLDNAEGGPPNSAPSGEYVRKHALARVLQEQARRQAAGFAVGDAGFANAEKKAEAARAALAKYPESARYSPDRCRGLFEKRFEELE